MELRHLRYFVTLAEELHFGRAAARMHITQPPFSRQIRELEQELNVSLFARNSKIVKLTDAGRSFYGHVREIQELLAQAIKTANRAQQGDFGRLAIGYLGAAAYQLLPNVLRQFQDSHPDVELTLHEMITTEQWEALSKGTIDVGIMRPTLGMEQYKSEVILREKFMVALPWDHRLARRQEIDIRSLAEEKFVMLSSTPGGLYRQIIDLCLKANFEPKVAHAATQTRFVVGLIGAGMGVSIVPSSAQRMNISGVVYRRLRGADNYAEIIMAWRKGEETAVVAQFLRALRDWAASSKGQHKRYRGGVEHV